jgi:hypothetical protein
VHAGFLLASALLRTARRITEYSLFAALAGAVFIFSSECPVRFAEDVGFNAAAYVLLVLATAALLWAAALHFAFGVAAARAGALPAGAPPAEQQLAKRRSSIARGDDDDDGDDLAAGVVDAPHDV